MRHVGRARQRPRHVRVGGQHDLFLLARLPRRVRRGPRGPRSGQMSGKTKHVRGVRRRRLGVFVLALGGLAAGCGGPKTSSVGDADAAERAPAGPTRLSEVGQVTIEVTWSGASSPAGGPVFAVGLDTHSVDLDAIDLRPLASLRADSGPEVPAADWDAPKGGHHRKGSLSFPAAVSGRPLIAPGARTLTLVIRDVGGVPERTFTWPL